MSMSAIENDPAWVRHLEALELVHILPGSRSSASLSGTLTMINGEQFTATGSGDIISIGESTGQNGVTTIT